MKRRRLHGKQPACHLTIDQDDAEDVDVSAAQSPQADWAMVPEHEIDGLQVEQADPDLPVHEDSAQDASAPSQRFDFLSPRTVNTIVSSLLQSKTDEELHSLTVARVLQDALAKSAGKVSETELTEKRDDFIAACMKLIPKELARRLVTAVASQSKPQSEAAALQPVGIDSQTYQKSYFVTISGLPESPEPSREEMQRTMLQAFREAGYSKETKVTHLAIFRETHRRGGVHFHIATCVSERCRCLPWKKALAKHGIAAHFQHIQIQGWAKHRKMQYQCMLRYCFVPTAKKPLASLDPEPLLYHCSGRHPPLIDAIQGELDAEAITLSVQEKFLQRAEHGKPGESRFQVSCICFGALFAPKNDC